MALTLLLNEWIKRHGGSLTALTVDHGLREDSAHEAAKLAAWFKIEGIPHKILAWHKTEMPKSAFHQRAREARYALLCEACKTENITHLFLAHHADDQAETFLMRLNKGSGLAGLACMARARLMKGIRLVRPLLPARKIQLEATCKASLWPCFYDPSNDLARFERTRVRRMLQKLEKDGYGVDTLYDLARGAGKWRYKNEIQLHVWLKTHGRCDAYGVAFLSFPAWQALNQEKRLAVLSHTLLCVGGEDYPPHRHALARLHDALHASSFSGQTLSGCRIQKNAQDIILMREEALAPKEFFLNALTHDITWDNRFRLSLLEKTFDSRFCIRPLGGMSRAALEKKQAYKVAQLHAPMRASLPGIFLKDDLISVPDFIGENPQASVKAVFFPKQPFLVAPFEVTAPLLSPFGVV
jgi:tRNA(Ile)-lysidine synthase